MQSWCYYKNIFKFFNYPLNGIKSLDIMEVYTTNDFAYDGNIYHPEFDAGTIENRSISCYYLSLSDEDKFKLMKPLKKQKEKT